MYATFNQLRALSPNITLVMFDLNSMFDFTMYRLAGLSDALEAQGTRVLLRDRHDELVVLCNDGNFYSNVRLDSESRARAVDRPPEERHHGRRRRRRFRRPRRRHAEAQHNQLRAHHLQRQRPVERDRRPALLRVRARLCGAVQRGAPVADQQHAKMDARTGDQRSLRGVQRRRVQLPCCAATWQRTRPAPDRLCWRPAWAAARPTRAASPLTCWRRRSTRTSAASAASRRCTATRTSAGRWVRRTGRPCSSPESGAAGSRRERWRAGTSREQGDRAVAGPADAAAAAAAALAAAAAAALAADRPGEMRHGPERPHV